MAEHSGEALCRLIEQYTAVKGSEDSFWEFFDAVETYFHEWLRERGIEAIEVPLGHVDRPPLRLIKG